MKKILLTGGTGLVGSRLIEMTDHEFYILTRSDKEDTAHVNYINWNNDDYLSQIPEVDLIINLAGASLSNRWTQQHKQAIVKSRIESTKKLGPIIEQQQKKPFLISASAVGYYPPAKNLSYTEADRFEAFDFLSKTVHLWEQEAAKLKVATAYCRFGVIFSNQGGALPIMVKPYQFYIGGNIGDGQQVYSWIHIDDLIRALLFIYDQQLTGIYNCTAPEPATQEEVGKAIAEALHKPHFLPVPEIALKTLLGEQAIMVTDGQRVLPDKLISAGFKFQHPTIKEAITSLYG
ncbi:TIGR01777 family protein [Macrococcus brunensis]|uniref:TIGR01777 family protein n=1 Tax=Macrococcus brunensis TaxID=198483 RepID=A0A4R6BEV3_9STAP|nr:TIGR01777 family oxidoreductase [Macrococcus brunensis]TDL98361.1 TIGR01777 family protein [Macrococcus brunensis]ULG72024.1 TIGR01777 family oxidoreductase [Macrococcus brunensis]ULG74277.1 TIGR01777 family oxidoreductase [Macrococcus brunensis]